MLTAIEKIIDKLRDEEAPTAGSHAAREICQSPLPNKALPMIEKIEPPHRPSGP